MSYDNEVIKICRLTNGWEVEIYDPPPAEVKAEEKAMKTGKMMDSPGVYRSPWRTMAFATFDEAVEFIEKKGPDLKPRNFDDEYAKSFDAAVKSMSKGHGKEETKETKGTGK